MADNGLQKIPEILSPAIWRLPLEGIWQFPFVLPPKAIYMLSDQILCEIAKQERPTAEAEERYNFVPSASIRGDGFSSCAALECQLSRLDLLARYAALYADRVLVPVSARRLLSDSIFEARWRLAHCLVKLRVLWPLIEAGNVKLFIDEYPICAAHSALFERVTRELMKSARQMYEEKIADFTLVYRPKRGKRRATLEITGPPELIDHGSVGLTYHGRPPTWAPKRITLIDGLPGAVLSTSAVKRHRIGIEIFHDFASDLVFQHWYGSEFQAHYLTDLRGEAEFLDRCRPDDPVHSNAAMVCRAMAHSVPLLDAIPVKRLLGIRAKETDAFELYRSALKRISREHIQSGKRVNSREATEIYNDVLRPQLLKLKRTADAHRAERRRKTAATVAASAAALAFGVLGGLQTGVLSSLLTAMGGGGLAREAVTAVLSASKNPPEVQSHELYFLLRLANTT